MQGGNSSDTAATLCQTHNNNKDYQTVVYSFMVSLEHRLPFTPFFSNCPLLLLPPIFLIFNCFFMSQFTTRGFRFNPTSFLSLPPYLLFEVLSRFCLERPSFCSPFSSSRCLLADLDTLIWCRNDMIENSASSTCLSQSVNHTMSRFEAVSSPAF